MNVPIIRLEIDGMRHAIATALTEYVGIMDRDIQEVVRKFCEPGNITDFVQREARGAIEHVCKSEIEDFFVHGKGREAVRRAIREMLEREEADNA